MDGRTDGRKERRKDRQTPFYRILPAEAGGREKNRGTVYALWEVFLEMIKSNFYSKCLSNLTATQNVYEKFNNQLGGLSH